MHSKKTVLIVGGGYAGANLARTLSEKLDASKYNIVLISSHPFYIHYPAGLRTVVTAEGTLEDRIFVPFDKLFVKGNGEFKQGTVTAIKAERNSKKGGEVVLDSGESISYDALALASGSRWETLLEFPVDDGGRREHLREWRDKFKDAKKVVIAGGGAVGIELAGEIRDFYPDKDITIVHGGTQLLNDTYPKKFRKNMEKKILASNIKIILDDFVDEFPPTATRKGIKLDADLVVPARGPRPNTKFIADSLGSDVLTNGGFVKTNSKLQLIPYPRIFALGDILDYAEQKQAAKYTGHTAVVAANIQSLLNGTEPTKEYKGTFEAILITNGRKGGAGYLDILWGVTLGDGLSASLKSKELMIGMARKGFGLTS